MFPAWKRGAPWNCDPYYYFHNETIDTIVNRGDRTITSPSEPCFGHILRCFVSVLLTTVNCHAKENMWNLIEVWQTNLITIIACNVNKINILKTAHYKFMGALFIRASRNDRAPSLVCAKFVPHQNNFIHLRYHDLNLWTYEIWQHLPKPVTKFYFYYLIVLNLWDVKEPTHSS